MRSCIPHRRSAILLTVLLACAAPHLPAAAARRAPVLKARTEFRIPDVPGYVTIRCDLHMHTVFSDGSVWPAARVDEAWREGYDAIAITDHIEYRPNKADIPADHNRSHEIAAAAGRPVGIIAVKGSEVSRNMPPGHFNALFLRDSNPLDTREWHDAIAAAHSQGAFIFWNHPGWDKQLVEGKITWFPEHTRLLQEGMLHGIEVANGRDYYPEAHRWAIEKKLAILGNSDVHLPIGMQYQLHADDRRPITLAFAADRTADALKQALFARQTAVVAGNLLLGDERFVRPIVERSLVLRTPSAAIRGKQKASLQLANLSDLDLELERTADPAELSIPARLTVPAGKVVLIEVQGRGTGDKGRRTVSMAYKATNVLPEPDRPLVISIAADITFEPSSTTGK